MDKIKEVAYAAALESSTAAMQDDLEMHADVALVELVSSTDDRCEIRVTMHDQKKRYFVVIVAEQVG